jgi:DNA-binding NarL/FixJ family response regulator
MVSRTEPKLPCDFDLTPRQLDVLRLLSEGFADKEIADRLGVSLYTVNKHVGTILLKLDTRSRTEAAIKAIRKGLID